MDEAPHPIERQQAFGQTPTASASFDQIRLREKLAGLAMAGEACRSWLDRDEPDLEEVRQLVNMMCDVSRQEFSLIAR
ncbi:hypothetical protein [Sphingomonas faeni]|uniref:hypothetical protein n=1 Tax=Sphingomonas faeni TaxID=185950 RepID=UPI0027877EA6|nr:hypothetical protein [Sphingomonas faeni]MDQ0839342.1 hypothetical protein [Sphingomonas faeni]